MRLNHPVSSAFSLWHKSLLMCLVLLTTAACADRSEQAMQYAAEAEQHFQAGNLWAARQSIGEAIGKRDDVPDLHLLRGRIEFSAESYGSAYAAYANALALDNTNMEALQAVSQLGLRTGNLRESLDATEQILSLQPTQPEALVTRGVHAFIQRRYDEAIEYADRALASRPSSEDPVILKSRAFFMAGDPAQALNVLQLAQEGSTPSAGIALTKLELYREMRDPRNMQAQFEILQQLRPNDAGLRIDEANLHFKTESKAAAQSLIVDLLGKEDLHREFASAAIDLLREYSAELSSSDVERIAASANRAVLIELARYLIEKDRASPAEIAIRQLPLSVAQPLLARLAVLKNRPSEALQIAEEVLSRDETECDALLAQANASLMKEDSLGALRSAQRAAAECPDRSEGWLAAAAAYSARSDPFGVQRIFRDAISTNPQSFLMTKTYADWLFEDGRPREALAVARGLTRKAPALLRGWEYYRSLCARSTSDCVSEAERGLADARVRYGVDLATGKLPPNGLFGRLVQR